MKDPEITTNPSNPEAEEKVVLKVTTTDSDRVFSFWKMAIAWSAVIGVIIIISILVNMAVYPD